MKSLLLTLLCCAFGLSAFNQTCDAITRPQLKEMVVQLGYTVKDIETAPGKEKVSVTINRDGMDIPIGLEISPSGNYIWLTVNLGDAKSDTASMHNALLKYNSKAQPCQFYITESKRLMMGLPAENRGLTNAILKQRIEHISKHVAESKSLWASW